MPSDKYIYAYAWSENYNAVAPYGLFVFEGKTPSHGEMAKARKQASSASSAHPDFDAILSALGELGYVGVFVEPSETYWF